VTPVTANPADPREVMVGVTSNMSILCRISFTKLTYKVIATFDRTLGLGREYYGGGENEIHLGAPQRGGLLFHARREQDGHSATEPPAYATAVLPPRSASRRGRW
jgi:hypothetical protein